MENGNGNSTEYERQDRVTGNGRLWGGQGPVCDVMTTTTTRELFAFKCSLLPERVNHCSPMGPWSPYEELAKRERPRMPNMGRRDEKSGSP